MNLQILDLQFDDLPKPTDKDEKEFLITLYGKTQDNKKVICHVENFKPYFYLKIPKAWSENVRLKISQFLGRNSPYFSDNDYHIEKYIKRTYNHDPKKDFLDSLTDKVENIDFYGFQCNDDLTPKTYLFAKLIFQSYSGMQKYVNAIREVYSHLKRRYIDETLYQVSSIHKEWFELDKNPQCDSNLYESNIHPIIRFIHLQKINPCGWITINNFRDDHNQYLFPISDFVLRANYTEINPMDKYDIHPFKIASFDIECDSSHGDFPVAKKDCKKLAIELFDQIDQSDIDEFDELDELDELDDLDDENDDIENDEFKKKLYKLIKHAFDDKHPGISILHTSFKDKRVKPPDKSIGLTAVKIATDLDILNLLIKDKDKNRDKIINLINDILNTYLLDHGKFKVLGDPIIQIGTVFQNYGSNKPTRRNIIVIGNREDLTDDDLQKEEIRKEICEDITDVQDPPIDIIRCKNEKDLLIKWKELMKTEDPDFVTGYNIFGFDFGYISDRIDLLCDCSCSYTHTKSCSWKKFYNLGNIDSSIENYKDHYSKKCSDKKQNLSSSGLGDNNLRYITMDGRILYDLQKEIQKGHSLDSYKLDDVASHFIRGKIKFIGCRKKINTSILKTNEIGRLKVGDYISLRTHSNIGEKLYNNGEKYYIKSIVEPDDDEPYYWINVNGLIHTWEESKKQRGVFKIEWCLNKDDVSPKDIFEKHQKGTGKDRALIAKYCIQDCELCLNLSLSLEIITNGVSMANVCYVPLSYIYLRGQGAKVFSIVAKECEAQGAKIPTLKRLFKPYEYTKIFEEFGRCRDKMKQYLIDEKYKERYKIENGKDWKEEKENDNKLYEEYETYLQEKRDGLNPEYMKKPRKLPYEDYDIEDKVDEIVNPPPRDGYEGAIVLEPTPGIYLDDPVSVLDYASLYPSSIIEKNLSHETLIEDPKYLKMVDYETIQYDNYMFIEKGKSIKKIINEEQPITTCYFKKKENEKELGIIPTVLQHLLTQRKNAKKKLKQEPDEFKKKVWDGLQLAYKVTANSVYGQMGARTSPIYKNKIAACTTSVGRSRIEDASVGVVKWAEQEGLEKPEVVYGDTDSVFVKFSRRNKEGVLLEGTEALKWCIDCGDKAGQWITDNMMHHPQVLEYEKTFYPFILVSKKRYIGDKYEFSIDDCKRTSMGIVLKRRDNAPIVKHVFGNMIEKIMVERDIEGAKLWIKDTLQKIKDGQMNPNEFYITKSLRGYYKNPQQIAHKVLADRIGLRDPGNKPKANDRIAYAYIKTKPKYTTEIYKSGSKKGQYKQEKILQGERIEIRQYIEENKCEYDYEFYITNQIKNPVKQVLELQYDSTQKEELKKLDEIFN